MFDSLDSPKGEAMQRLNVFRQKGLPMAQWGCWLACCCLAAASSLPAGAQQAQIDASSLTIRPDGRAMAVYRFVENPAKPYVASLCTPGGVNVLRDSPADHKHHHGLMFAVAVDGVDFWSENPKCGRQVNRSRSFLGPVATNMPQLGGRYDSIFSIGPQPIDWTAPSGKILLRETRQISVRVMPQSGATLVTWQTNFAPPGDKAVTLSGSPYFGLGMRFVPSMDKGGEFVNADGRTGVSGTNDVRSAWCAYSASADGKPVTVAMFDDPKNARHPATWFTMDQGFAYLAATLDLSREPLIIQPGKPLPLRYQVAVWDGKVDAAKIAALYRETTGGTH